MLHRRVYRSRSSKKRRWTTFENSLLIKRREEKVGFRYIAKELNRSFSDVYEQYGGLVTRGKRIVDQGPWQRRCANCGIVFTCYDLGREYCKDGCKPVEKTFMGHMRVYKHFHHHLVPLI